jgi:hypothetical protein
MSKQLKVTLHRHGVVAKCGSFEVGFHDGRESVYFRWDDIPGRRLKPGQMDSATALEAAKALAKAERNKP